MPITANKRQHEVFGQLVSEFSFGLSFIEFTHGGNTFTYLGVEVPQLLVGYLGGVDPVPVRDENGDVVNIPNADMPAFFAAMFGAIDPQRAAFANKYKGWVQSTPANVDQIDVRSGWARRSPALIEFEKPDQAP